MAKLAYVITSLTIKTADESGNDLYAYIRAMLAIQTEVWRKHNGTATITAIGNFNNVSLKLEQDTTFEGLVAWYNYHRDMKGEERDQTVQAALGEIWQRQLPANEAILHIADVGTGQPIAPIPA